MSESTNQRRDPKPSSATSSRTRVARVACKACHARRVKCDAADGQPCWHCRTRHVPCELIESKRGKYARRSSAQPRQRVSRRLQPTQSPVTERNDTPASDVIAVNSQRNGNAQHSEDRELTASHDTRTTITDNDSQPGPHVPDKSYYLGDSSSLSYIVEMICSPRGGVSEPVKVHYPIPASIVDRAVMPTRPQVEPLSVQDALVMPSKEISDRLIYVFFDLLHPPYPVLDRCAFSEQYKLGTASPMLLHTMFLVTFILCDDSLIQEAGFADRSAARKFHYLRAKTLYDVDHETDRNAIAATLFLLGFWWNGPEDQKDSWFWLGCATTYAQSLGMHRSAAASRWCPKKIALRKRIWWSIYTRDRHTAACLGRPCRIRDEDCDIEPLTEADFHFDDNHGDPLIPPQKDYHTAYAIEMAKATEILGDIVIGEYSPRRPVSDRYNAAHLKSRLEQWEAQLPECMKKAPPDETLGAAFWASQLHMAYQNYYILLFRPKAIGDLSPSEAEGDVCARRAADSITRMTEDLLAVGAIRFSQMHIVPAVFGALSIHTLVICRKDPIRRQLAGNKSRQCILALSELAKSWPVGLWIMKFFVRLMRNLTGQGSGPSAGPIVDVTSRISKDSRENEGSTLGPSSESSRDVSQNPGDPRAFNQQPDLFNTQSLNAERSGMEEQQVPEMFAWPGDQFGSDSFWAEDTIDVDLLLQHGLCPLLPANFGAAPGVDTFNS
ncbi:fungal-specific transcription factor domain-containing protein [Fusarium tricinctum]|uniref:Fungal-specific transcription factor domain-containing protein n=1 Tax=Fusarium tricinctum TaxID=61284 RepID=A0A8K0S7C4_9HYPO|nr:fungal-specific transcription factor domain-containing protein [Fusarium tricinctum]